MALQRETEQPVDSLLAVLIVTWSEDVVWNRSQDVDLSEPLCWPTGMFYSLATWRAPSNLHHLQSDLIEQKIINIPDLIWIALEEAELKVWSFETAWVRSLEDRRRAVNRFYTMFAEARTECFLNAQPLKEPGDYKLDINKQGRQLSGEQHDQ